MVDSVTVTIYNNKKMEAEMEVGSIVKFRDGLYADEVENTYVVIEDNGDRVFVKAIMENFRFPPVSVARTSELELLQAPNA